MDTPEFPGQVLDATASENRGCSAVGAAPLGLTFVIPGRGRAGGVRATVEMANHLVARGHNVRIATKHESALSPLTMRRSLARVWLRVNGYAHTDWIQDFKGDTVRFTRLNDLRFDLDEIVVAVGPRMIRAVHELDAQVIKMRWCVGFSEHEPDVMSSVWSLPMPTIAVSAPLIPIVERFSGQKVVGVVPNGVDLSVYFDENRQRDGVGAMYAYGYRKNPEGTLQILERVKKRWPNLRRHVFGARRRPLTLAANEYTRYPSVDEARAIYNRCLIWLVPSRSEGFSLPIIEAMACGCVLISADHYGSREIIRDGTNGFRVPGDNMDGFLDRIGLLLADEPLRARFVAEGQMTSQRFNWEAAALKMESCVRQILSQRSTTQ